MNPDLNEPFSVPIFFNKSSCHAERPCLVIWCILHLGLIAEGASRNCSSPGPGLVYQGLPYWVQVGISLITQIFQIHDGKLDNNPRTEFRVIFKIDPWFHSVQTKLGNVYILEITPLRSWYILWSHVHSLLTQLCRSLEVYLAKLACSTGILLVEDESLAFYVLQLPRFWNRVTVLHSSALKLSERHSLVAVHAILGKLSKE